MINPGPPHEECWAKTREDGSPGINVRDHCLNVGCVAEALISLISRNLPFAATLAALHDIGKVSPGFQRKCEPWLQRHGLIERALKEAWSMQESDHAKISQATLQGMLGRSNLFPWASAVGAHHGHIKGERIHSHKAWEHERRRLADELIAEFGPLPDQPPDDNEAWLWFVAGLITVADWIGSDEHHFPQESDWSISDRRERARAALRNIGWERAPVKSLDGFSQLFPELGSPNSLQTAILDRVKEPGVYIIEGPMGCGKTEAALAAAYQLIAANKASGLYFALPTQLTSNRIHRRVQAFIEQISIEHSSVRLAHSGSWLVQGDQVPKLRPSDAQDGEAREHIRAGRSWFASAKRALLSSYGVGTIDQALLGIVAAKHFFVRQFGLAGKVVILDEVHTYDLYTSTLIDELMTRLRELDCTVLILSATLSSNRRRQFLGRSQDETTIEDYPLLSGSHIEDTPCEPPPPKEVFVRFVEPDQLVDQVLERAQDGQCVLWIRNTVDGAQETYRLLKASNREGGPEIALLHSRFPFFRREQLEARWMEQLGKDSRDRPQGCVLVSTQVAEQSVDIDADLLVTDLAPTDMLLQRIGRLWRHFRARPEHWRPEAWIASVDLDDDELATATPRELCEAFGKSSRVYAPYVLLRSLVQWRSLQSITLPTEIRHLLEATYSDASSTEPVSWQRLRSSLEEAKESMTKKALSATRVWNQPALSDEEGIQTRLVSAPTTRLLLVRDLQMTRNGGGWVRLADQTTREIDPRTWELETARALHRNLVPVPLWVVPPSQRKFETMLAQYLPRPAAVGLLLDDGRVQWPGNGDETALSYHAEMGVVISRIAKSTGTWEDFDESYD